ncbi:MAG: hypothetical protein IJ794_03410 [Lachnospiraceae bacterium]|nr:hypothetical protein [Lachnospiraceae bacterium]
MKRLKENFEKNKKQCYMLLAAAVFVSLPLCTDFVNVGEDLAVSLSRIRAVGEGVFHAFPLRLGPLPKTTYGYGASVFSADVFYLLPGLLYRVGISLQNAYKITVVCFNLVTAFLAYISFQGITGERDAGMAAGFLYVLCPCRIYSIYGSENLSEVFAWTFLPLAVWGICRLFVQKKYDGTAVILTAGYTLTLLAWPVYFFGAAAVFVLFFVFTVKESLKKPALMVIGKFVLAFVCVNAWYLLPMVLRMRDVQAVSPLLTEHIREYAVYLSQYVKVFEFGGSRLNVWERGLTSAAAINPGFTVVCLVVFYLCTVFVTGQKDKDLDRILLAAGVFMLLSSNLFPWDLLQNKNMLFSILLAMLQTPAKLAVMVDVLLIAGAGVALTRVQRIQGWMVCLAGFLTAQFQVGRLLTLKGFLREEQVMELSQIGYSVIENESLFWRAAEGVSVVAVVALLVYGCRFGRKAGV